jgi:hypothetical protein
MHCHRRLPILVFAPKDIEGEGGRVSQKSKEKVEKEGGKVQRVIRSGTQLVSTYQEEKWKNEEEDRGGGLI